MTNEIDQLIWNVLDGKASEGKIRELKSWMEESEKHREYFRQWKKIWNMTSGPTLSTTRKQQEKERFLKSIHQSYVGKVRKRNTLLACGSICCFVGGGVCGICTQRVEPDES